MRLISVDLPLPVLPTIAVVWPGSIANEIDLRTGSSAPGYRKVTSRNATWPRGRPRSPSRLTGVWGSARLTSVSRTSWIRSAEAAARGTMTNMITAIITENRISITYCRNAIRLPICIAPLSTWMAPNQMIATDERLKIAMIVGIISANSRLTRRVVAVRS